MKNRGTWLRLGFVCLCLLGTQLFLYAHRQSENIPKSVPVSDFPLNLGEWRGRDLPIQPDVLEVLGPGDFLTRLYQRDPMDPFVDFFIAYFPSQKTGDTIHSPQNCLPGAGWTFTDAQRVQLQAGGVTPITVNRYIISKGNDRQLVLYWYQAHGRAVASEYWAKFYLIADSIRLNRTDGALVRIITPMIPGESTGKAQERATSFAQLILPQLNQYIPN